MIVDALTNIYRYKDLHPNFEEAFNFIKIHDLIKLPVGKYEIIKNKAFLILEKNAAKSKEDAYLESHLKYIDIQVILQGTDEMGWTSINQCNSPIEDYNIKKDIQFFYDKPRFFIPVPEEHFAIFFPDDAHMPLIGKGIIHKAIAKIAV
ncbi:MAG TPA: YhcH/YjgK/YiaL family protein [Victivallales bacterium]|nr:YhcH/YjgK/YiaL family protein [Victivallales bacterium]